MRTVLVGNRYIAFSSAPQSMQERRIIPQQSPVVRRRIIAGDLVGDLGIGFKRDEPVREADRDVNLVAGGGAHDSADMLAENGRTPTKVDRHVEYGARRTRTSFP